MTSRLVDLLPLGALAWGALAFGAVYPWAYWPLAALCVLSGLGGGTSSKRETEGKVLPGGSVWTFALMPE